MRLEIIEQMESKKMMIRKAYVCGLFLAGYALGAGAQSALPKGAVATVNGTAVTEQLHEKNVQMNVAQGQKDTPQLRQAIKEEMIAREVFAQEAVKRGLDKSPQAQEAWAVVHQNFLIDLLVNDQLSKSPVSDADLRAEYERQVKSLGDAQQYLLRHMVLGSQAQAQAVIAELGKGADFDKMAREKSLDPSKQQGGSLGWLLPNQITPAVANVIVNLGKGVVGAAPIQVNEAWHVVRVDDKRAYQPPAFDESKEALRQGLLQKKRAELLGQLLKTANIKQ